MTGWENWGEILRLCGCGVLAAVCLLVLRGLDKNGISGMASACIGAAFAILAVSAAEPILSMLRSYGALYLGEGHAALLLRVMAIGMTVQLTADTIRDAGEGSLADRVEHVGHAVMLCVGIPLYQEILSLAGQLLGM